MTKKRQRTYAVNNRVIVHKGIIIHIPMLSLSLYLNRSRHCTRVLTIVIVASMHSTKSSLKEHKAIWPAH